MNPKEKAEFLEGEKAIPKGPWTIRFNAASVPVLHDADDHAVANFNDLDVAEFVSTSRNAIRETMTEALLYEAKTRQYAPYALIYLLTQAGAMYQASRNAIKMTPHQFYKAMGLVAKAHGETKAWEEFTGTKWPFGGDIHEQLDMLGQDAGGWWVHARDGDVFLRWAQWDKATDMDDKPRAIRLVN